MDEEHEFDEDTEDEGPDFNQESFYDWIEQCCLQIDTWTRYKAGVELNVGQMLMEAREETAEIIDAVFGNREVCCHAELALMVEAVFRRGGERIGIVDPSFEQEPVLVRRLEKEGNTDTIGLSPESVQQAVAEVDEESFPRTSPCDQSGGVTATAVDSERIARSLSKVSPQRENQDDWSMGFHCAVELLTEALTDGNPQFDRERFQHAVYDPSAVEKVGGTSREPVRPGALPDWRVFREAAEKRPAMLSSELQKAAEVICQKANARFGELCQQETAMLPEIKSDVEHGHHGSPKHADRLSETEREKYQLVAQIDAIETLFKLGLERKYDEDE